jgi:hypothetical protein
MNMNDLYQRRGEERLRALAAASLPARAAHLELSELYARRIRQSRGRA